MTANGTRGHHAMDISAFAGRTPELRIEEYFTGRTRAWGVFEDRFGTLRRSFTVDMTGIRDGAGLILEEVFLYDDGERQKRIWTITRTADGGYEGSADDVVGIATGRAAGNAIHWRYAMDLKVGRGTWRVSFDDWMILQPDGVLINRTHMRRWGVWIGTLSLFFRPWPEARERTAA